MIQFSRLSHRQAFPSLRLAAVALFEAPAMIVGGGIHCHRILGCMSMDVELVGSNIRTWLAGHGCYSRHILCTPSPVDAPSGLELVCGEIGLLRCWVVLSIKLVPDQP